MLPHRPRNLFLLAASYFFYGCWSWKFLSLIVISTLVDYYCSHGIEEAASEKRKKLLLVTSCVVNLGILGFFKHANFFVDSLEQSLSFYGYDPGSWRLDIVLPVGISFYTFQTMSYTIDVYRGQLKPLKNVIDFALYVAFFPQLVAGPIERGAHLAPQMTRKTVPHWDDISFGSWLCLKGLFKKAVIADNMAVIVDQVYNSNEPVSGTAVLLATYAFAFQIYGDFSGYSDIARGTARMMGYDLMLNFRLPYFSRSPSEFWQRWHISLSSWLRDYLYIPLGGNRGGEWKTIRNLMLTMLLGGLWHGAAVTYLIWGIFHGIILATHRIWRNFFPVTNNKPNIIVRLIQMILMFHLICVGWLFFRANSIESLFLMSHALLTNWQWNKELAVMTWQIILLCAPLLCVQWLQEQTKDINLIRNLSLAPRTLAYTVVVVAILTLGSFGGREFIYFQF